MSLFDGLRHRLHVLFHRNEYAQETQRELEFHVCLDAAQMRRDLPEAERASAAKRRLGNLTLIREDVRRVSGMAMLDTIRQDCFYAWRAIRHAPGFAVSIVVIVALGVGANAAVFAILDRALLRTPGGLSAPDRLGRLYVHESGAQDSAQSIGRLFTASQVASLKQALSGTAQVGGLWAIDTATVAGTGSAALTHVASVTAGYLPLLVGRPAHGRFFSSDEADPSVSAAVAVVGYSLWQRVLGGKPSAVGSSVSVGLQRYTVIGVAPKGFTGIGFDQIEVWLPLGATVGGGTQTSSGSVAQMQVAVLLTPSTTKPIVEQIGTRSINELAQGRSTAKSIRRVVVGSIVADRGPGQQSKETSVATRLGIVSSALFLSAWANVGVLFLLRAGQRRREIAVRLALGASRTRLASHLLSESLLLAITGGGIALLVASYGSSVLRSGLLPNSPVTGSLLHPRVVVFCLGSALLIGLLAGILQLRRAGSAGIGLSLRSGRREGGSQRSVLRAVLLVSQTALCVALLSTAGLFVRSLYNVSTIRLGFDSEKVLVASVRFAERRARPELRAILEEAADRLRATPGVERVAVSNGAPFSSVITQSIAVPGLDSAPKLNGSPQLLVVTPDYFAVTGTRILEGRGFLPSDRIGSPNVAVVTRTMAHGIWPRDGAIGRCIRFGAEENPCNTVVGIAEDVHSFSLVESPAYRYFLPLDQQARTNGLWTPSHIVLRSSAPRRAAVMRLTQEELVRRLPTATITVHSLADQLAPQYRPWRLSAWLFTLLAVLALLVATVGVYSTVAFSLSQRTRELSVRMALGARTSHIGQLVVKEALGFVGGGVVAGILLSLVIGRLVQSLLFDVRGSDPVVLATASFVFLLAGTLACVPPAIQASVVNPAIAMRSE